MTGTNDDARWSAPGWSAPPVDPDHQRLLDKIFQDVEVEMMARLQHHQSSPGERRKR